MIKLKFLGCFIGEFRREIWDDVDYNEMQVGSCFIMYYKLYLTHVFFYFLIILMQ